MNEHWLARPQTIRRLWRIFILALAASLLAELAVAPEPHFAVERLFGAYALYGFTACAALILVAKAIGRFLKRPEGYYDD
ncbi:MAG TPA: hypothetical protein VNK67_05450 [Burkholderiales bacterium]|nr:hypothetical protein [Burkholderiales bacterium]